MIDYKLDAFNLVCVKNSINVKRSTIVYKRIGYNSISFFRVNPPDSFHSHIGLQFYSDRISPHTLSFYMVVIKSIIDANDMMNKIIEELKQLQQETH